MPRFRIVATLTIAAALAGCSTASRAARGPAPAEAELHAAANALFAAMASRDTAALRAMFTPDARLVSMRVQAGGEPVVRTTTVSEFVASIARGTETLRERMWDPEVQVADDFAALWAPYDFHVGERFSHCGHDAFHFARTATGWKIAALTYTVRTSPCEAPPRTP